MSLSAVGTGSAVVCSGYRGGCRRFVVFVIAQRLHGRLALTMHRREEFHHREHRGHRGVIFRVRQWGGKSRVVHDEQYRIFVQKKRSPNLWGIRRNLLVNKYK